MRQKFYAVFPWAGLVASMAGFLVNGFIFPEADEAIPWGYRILFVTLLLGIIGSAFAWTRWGLRSIRRPH